jgi:hypothetical protein
MCATLNITRGQEEMGWQLQEKDFS